MGGRKVLYTLSVDGYAPGITALTFPLMRHYARKIGAEFHVIGERRYPAWPVACEKFQVYDLAREAGAEWAMFLDADTLVHPETIDFTQHIPKDTVAHNGADFAPVRWRPHEYLLRDGRNIGSCNWCAIASEWCLDFWNPAGLAGSPDKVAECIYPVLEELNTGLVAPEHLIDDYLMSLNVARYGLKFTTLIDLEKRLGMSGTYFFWHQYLIPAREKVRQMREVIALWGVPDSILPRSLWEWPRWQERKLGVDGRPQLDADGRIQFVVPAPAE